MSYHTHNLKVGDRFSDTPSLDIGNFEEEVDEWEVVEVRQKIGKYGDTFLVAKSLSDPNKEIRGQFNGDISLCMIEGKDGFRP